MKKRDRWVADCLIDYYLQYRCVPPSGGYMISYMAEHRKRRYLILIHYLSARCPALVQALIHIERQQDDGGPESDGGPVPGDMMKTVHSGVKPIEHDGIFREYQ